MSDTAKIKTPSWDGTAESAPMYIIKFKAMAECSDYGDALDATEVATMITATAYANESDKTKSACKLYEKNRRLGGLFVLGQDSVHGLAMFSSTVTTNHPHGKICNALAKMEAKFRPGDTTAELELDTALEAIRFSRADDYFNQVIKVRSQYAVDKSEADLIKLMARKVNSATYSKMILDHLGSAKANDFELICSEISGVQRLAGVGSGSRPKENSGKEIAVVNPDGVKTGNFKGECNYCKKVCGYRIKDCPAKKAFDARSGGGSGGGGNAKVCNFCGKKGHVEDGCWKKHPHKTPDWLKEKWAKSGDGKETGNVEVCVAAIEKDTKVPELCTICATVQAHDPEKCTTWQEMAAIEESGQWAKLQQAMEAWQARMQDAVDQMKVNHEERDDSLDFQQARC